MKIRRLLPRSLRRQFLLAVAGLTLLILAGSLTAIFALRQSAGTIRELAEERLIRMQEALDLTERTLLIERESNQMANAESLAEMHETYADILRQLQLFDNLVEHMTGSGDDTSILELHQASQMFRNTANVVAQMRESVLQSDASQHPPEDKVPLVRRQAEEKVFVLELRRQASALVALARLRSTAFGQGYREAVQQLAQTSTHNERWVTALMAGSLALAWLFAHAFLGKHVLARLQEVSHNLRLSDGEAAASAALDTGGDEIDEMAHAVRLFQEDRRQLARRSAELIQARDAADAANKAKSVFLASMSHELRTPLNAILGFSSLMRLETDLSEGQRENLDIINRSGQHLLSLINDVLEMAKIEAGRIQLEVAPFDLGTMVREVTDMMRLRAEEKGLQLLVDQSSEFPRYIKADEARLRQILINLVSNAVKFTEQGGVTVRLGVMSNHRDHLVIEVEDSGPGIKPEDRQRIFEPFVQVGDGAAKGGSGLGLSITRQFVRLMGGSITLEPSRGKGALFRVDLPLELAQESDIDDLIEPMEKRDVVGLAPGQPVYRVLITEDQRENQRLLERLMNGIGIDTRIAEDGTECLRLFQEWHPDLIWMDRRMPVMDGVETTRRIRALPGGDKVKIIAVTASAFKEQQQEMFDAGMDDFVPKPYRFSEIYACLARHLGVRYIYSDESTQAKRGSASRLVPAALAMLPTALREELRSASETLDSEHIMAAIRKVDEIDPELASKLRSLADGFDYQAILNALDAKGGYS